AGTGVERHEAAPGGAARETGLAGEVPLVGRHADEDAAVVHDGTAGDGGVGALLDLLDPPQRAVGPAHLGDVGAVEQCRVARAAVIVRAVIVVLVARHLVTGAQEPAVGVM